MKFTLREIILTGIFAAITAVLAQVSIPNPFSPAVPITMQIFAVCLTAAILGSKCGFFSQITYILLGICGVPVFANFKSGLGIIMGPTGGFLISFPIIALVMGLVIERKKQVSVMNILGSMAIGLVMCYSMGAVWMAAVLKLTAAKVIALGVLPFLPLDILKIIAASFLGYHVRSALIRANLLQPDSCL